MQNTNTLSGAWSRRCDQSRRVWDALASIQQLMSDHHILIAAGYLIWRAMYQAQHVGILVAEQPETVAKTSSNRRALMLPYLFHAPNSQTPGVPLQ